MAYGKIIPGLEIHDRPAPYGVVNEREIRAASGLMFVVGFFALMTLYYDRNLWLAFSVVAIFWVDFVLKVFIGPHASFFGKIGAWLVRNQRPEYVGAVQKRFAWSIGLFISSLVLVLVGYQLFLAPVCLHPMALAVGSSCLLPMLLCGICLIFLWFESAVGYCVGCAIYTGLVKRGALKSQEFAPACPGGICDAKED
jgi:hypothetical protein